MQAEKWKVGALHAHSGTTLKDIGESIFSKIYFGGALDHLLGAQRGRTKV